MEQGARHRCRDGGLSDDIAAVLQLDNLASLEGVAHGFESRWGELCSVTGSSAARVHQVHGSAVLALPDDRSSWDPFRADDPQARPAADMDLDLYHGGVDNLSWLHGHLQAQPMSDVPQESP